MIGPAWLVTVCPAPPGASRAAIREIAESWADAVDSATSLAVLAISPMPDLAVAECPGDHSGETAASCLHGMVRDAGTGSCVEKPAS